MIKMRSENKILLSFSGTISICLILIYYIGGIFFYFFYITIQNSFPNINFEQKLFLLITLIFWIPIFSIYLFIQNLPFKPIDFKINKIILSLFQKIIFIVTFPIFLLSLYIEIFIIQLVFKDQITITLMVLTFDFFPLFIWIIFSLFLWELINGKGSSQSLTLVRHRRPSLYKNQNNNENKLTYSKR